MDGYGEIKATPIKRDWAMKVANALRTGRDVANKVEIPVLGGLGDVFIGKSPEGFERVAYDEPLTKGAGWTTKPTDELVDMAFLGFDVAPIARTAVRGAAKAATAGSDRLVQAIMKNKDVTGMDAIKAAGELSPVKNIVRQIPLEMIEHGESAMPGGKLTWPGARDLIKKYAAMPTDIPPIRAIAPDEDSAKWMIEDGSHRYEAAKLRGMKTIPVEID